MVSKAGEYHILPLRSELNDEAYFVNAFFDRYPELSQTEESASRKEGYENSTPQTYREDTELQVAARETVVISGDNIIMQREVAARKVTSRSYVIFDALSSIFSHIGNINIISTNINSNNRTITNVSTNTDKDDSNESLILIAKVAIGALIFGLTVAGGWFLKKYQVAKEQATDTQVLKEFVGQKLSENNEMLEGSIKPLSELVLVYDQIKYFNEIMEGVKIHLAKLSSVKDDLMQSQRYFNFLERENLSEEQLILDCQGSVDNAFSWIAYCEEKRLNCETGLKGQGELLSSAIDLIHERFTLNKENLQSILGKLDEDIITMSEQLKQSASELKGLTGTLHCHSQSCGGQQYLKSDYDAFQSACQNLDDRINEQIEVINSGLDAYNVAINDLNNKAHSTEEDEEFNRLLAAKDYYSATYGNLSRFQDVVNLQLKHDKKLMKQPLTYVKLTAAAVAGLAISLIGLFTPYTYIVTAGALVAFVAVCLGGGYFTYHYGDKAKMHKALLKKHFSELSTIYQWAQKERANTDPVMQLN